MGTTASGLWFPDTNTQLGSLHTLLSTMQSSVETAFGKDTVPEVATIADANIARTARGTHTVTIAGVLYTYDTASSTWRSQVYDKPNFGLMQATSTAAYPAASSGGGNGNTFNFLTWNAFTTQTYGSGYTMAAPGMTPTETGWYDVSGLIDLPANFTGGRRNLYFATVGAGAPSSEFPVAAGISPNTSGGGSPINIAGTVRLTGGNQYTLVFFHDANAGSTSPTTISIARRSLTMARRY